MGYIAAIVLALALVIALALPEGARIANVPAGELAVNSTWLLLAVLMAASLIHRYRGRLSAAARDALIWVALGAGFLALYAYRDVFSDLTDRVRAEISPGYAISSKPGVAEIARRRDGHFIVRMKANGVELPFLFDTGASTVTLRAEDAKRLGIDVKALAFTEVVSTANGVTRAAITRLASLSVGGITQNRVEAMVAREGSLNENLLGQNFLSGLAGYGVEKDRLILRGKF